MRNFHTRHTEVNEQTLNDFSRPLKSIGDLINDVMRFEDNIVKLKIAKMISMHDQREEKTATHIARDQLLDVALQQHFMLMIACDAIAGLVKTLHEHDIIASGYFNQEDSFPDFESFLSQSVAGKVLEHEIKKLKPVWSAQ